MQEMIRECDTSSRVHLLTSIEFLEGVALSHDVGSEDQRCGHPNALRGCIGVNRLQNALLSKEGKPPEEATMYPRCV